MFNIGPGELIAISIVALLVLGPQRLPEAVRTVGRVIGELRRISGGFQDELRNALDDSEIDDLDTRRSYRPPPSLPPLTEADSDPVPATVVDRPEPGTADPEADAGVAQLSTQPPDHAPPAADPPASAPRADAQRSSDGQPAAEPRAGAEQPAGQSIAAEEAAGHRVNDEGDRP